MGLFKTLFRSDSSSEGSVRVRQSKENNDRITADKYTHRGGDSHEHSSYNINTSTGEYREYHGGENSHDRRSDK